MLSETSTCCWLDYFLVTCLLLLQANTDSVLLCVWCYVKCFMCFASCGSPRNSPIIELVLLSSFIEKPEVWRGWEPSPSLYSWWRGGQGCGQYMVREPVLLVLTGWLLSIRCGFSLYLILWAISSALHACRFSLLSERPPGPFQSLREAQLISIFWDAWYIGIEEMTKCIKIGEFYMFSSVSASLWFSFSCA